MTYQHRKPFQADDEVDRLIYHMPTVARLATDEWSKNFAKSVIGQSRRRGWTPSTKQLSVMHGLVNDLFAPDSDDGGDFDLIES